jgi:hypothetical protein
MGEKVEQITWTGSDGNPFSLHDLCYQGSAIMVVETAIWCSACTQLAPTIRAAAQFYEQFGVKTIIALGQDASYGPSTTGMANQYKQAHSYDDPIIVVNDPNWQKLHASVTHGGDFVNYLPTFIVFDHDMEIRLSEGDVNSAFNALAQITGEVFQP